MNQRRESYPGIIKPPVPEPPVPPPLPFKEQMAALGDGPTYEFLMNLLDESGDLINTGTIIGNAEDYYIHNPSVTYDEFVGACLFSAVYDSWWSPTVTWSTISHTTDRSWVFVWENTSHAAGAWWNKDLVEFVGGKSWGYLKIAAAQVRFQQAPFANFAGLNNLYLAAGNASGQSAGNSASTLTGAVGKRCVLFITYDHAGAEFIIRWKQTGDPAGHTFAESARTSTVSPTGTVNVKWVGTTGAGSPRNVTWRYMAVIDHVISESEADALFDVAGL